MMNEAKVNRAADLIVEFIRDDLRGINKAISQGELTDLVDSANQLACDASVMIGLCSVLTDVDIDEMIEELEKIKAECGDTE